MTSSPGIILTLQAFTNYMMCNCTHTKKCPQTYRSNQKIIGSKLCIIVIITVGFYCQHYCVCRCHVKIVSCAIIAHDFIFILHSEVKTKLGWCWLQFIYMIGSLVHYNVVCTWPSRNCTTIQGLKSDSLT